MITKQQESFEKDSPYNGVEEDGLVKSGHKRIDWILVVGVVEFIAGDPFNFVTKVTILFRVRNSGRHGQQGFLEELTHPIFQRVNVINQISILRRLSWIAGFVHPCRSRCTKVLGWRCCCWINRNKKLSQFYAILLLAAHVVRQWQLVPE